MIDEDGTKAITLYDYESSDRDTEMSKETIVEQSHALYLKWTKDVEVLSKKKREEVELIQKVRSLEAEMTSLTQKLVEAQKNREAVANIYSETKRELTQ